MLGSRVMDGMVGMVSAGLANARAALSASGHFGRRKGSRGWRGKMSTRFTATLNAKPRKRRTKSERERALLAVSGQDQRNRDRVADQHAAKRQDRLEREQRITANRLLRERHAKEVVKPVFD